MRLWLPLFAVALTILLVSWDQKQAPGDYRQQYHAADTTPKKKTDKKIRDLDEALAELESLDLKAELEKVHEEVARAMKQIDRGKIQLEIEKSLKQVDFEKIREEIESSIAKVDFKKIQAEIESAMKEVNMEKIQQQVKESMEKVNWEQLKKELEEVKNINVDISAEMKKVEEEMKKIGPQIKEEMEKAKVHIEKAKAEMKEYKEFVDGLEKDGLLNKKENYSIRHKDGELTVNGKKVSEQVYNKYRSFLEKHKNFTLNKEADDFNLDID